MCRLRHGRRRGTPEFGAVPAQLRGRDEGASPIRRVRAGHDRIHVCTRSVSLRTGVLPPVGNRAVAAGTSDGNQSQEIAVRKLYELKTVVCDDALEFTSGHGSSSRSRLRCTKGTKYGSLLPALARLVGSLARPGAVRICVLYPYKNATMLTIISLLTFGILFPTKGVAHR
ncbi:unnamed protein product [Amoebophrya sp. A120]|nr:unnamed protein product [Amoebophrya sp. A120]|eukprot:GSA120T00025236001.1